MPSIKKQKTKEKGAHKSEMSDLADMKVMLEHCSVNEFDAIASTRGSEMDLMFNQPHEGNTFKKGRIQVNDEL